MFYSTRNIRVFPPSFVTCWSGLVTSLSPYGPSVQRGCCKCWALGGLAVVGAVFQHSPSPRGCRG